MIRGLGGRNKGRDGGMGRPQHTPQRVCGDDVAPCCGRRATATRGGHFFLDAGTTASLVSGLTMLLFPSSAASASASAAAVPRRTTALAPAPAPAHDPAIARACLAVLPRHPSMVMMPRGMPLVLRPHATTSSSGVRSVPRCGLMSMSSLQSGMGRWGVQQWDGLKLNAPGFEGALTRADPITGECAEKDIAWSVEVKHLCALPDHSHPHERS